MTEEHNKKIICVGLCVLDIIHVCPEYPEEDTDKRCLKGHCQRGGNASNNCTVLRRLGAKCEFLGVLSTSKAFQYLIDDCHQRNIEIKNCPMVQQDPPFSSVILSEKTGTRTIIHSNPNFPILTYDDFRKIDLNEYEWIHFEGRYPEHTTKMMQNIIEYNCRSGKQIQISIELEKVKEEILTLANYADYVFLGKDLAIYLGWNDMKTAVYGLRDKIKATKKRCCIICPWGSYGAAVLDSNNSFFIADAYRLEGAKIVDSLGAGDTFCAAVIYALCYQRKSLHDAIRFGNQIAGYKLTFYGYDGIDEKLLSLSNK